MENLALILVHLSTAINAVADVNGIEKELLINSFNTALTTLNKQLTADSSQTKLVIAADNKIVEQSTKQKTNEPTQQTTPAKKETTAVEKTTTVSEKDKKPVLNVVKKEEKQAPSKIKDSSEEPLTATEAFNLVFDEVKSIIRLRNEKTISSTIETVIKSTIKVIYGRVHPVHENATDAGADKFYTNFLMIPVIESLKKEGLEVMLSAEKKETVISAPETTSSVAPEVTNTKETPTIPEVTTEQTKTNSIVDEAAKLIEAADKGIEVTLATEPLKVETPSLEEKPTVTTASVSNTDTTIALVPIETLAETLVEELKDITPTAPQTISNSLKEKAKDIFISIYEADKGKSISLGGKSYLFHDYMDEVTKKIKKLTGDFEKSPIVKVGNKPQIKLIKTWAAEWSKSA